ncbi:MAG: hypothetical protein ABIH34_04665 [Nanoarchaeota archaeon]
MGEYAHVHDMVPGIDASGLESIDDLALRRAILAGRESSQLSKEGRAFLDQHRSAKGFPYPPGIISRFLHSRIYEEWCGELEQCSMTFCKGVQGQIVIDLGSGALIPPQGASISEMCGASGYIAVESLFATDYAGNTAWLDKVSIPVAVVAEDMKQFMKRLPDKSVSLLASGIDAMVLHDPHHLKECNEEVERVLHPEGILLCYHSCLRPEGLKREEHMPRYGMKNDVFVRFSRG